MRPLPPGWSKARQQLPSNVSLVIRFDDVADGTDVSSHYHNLGVTLSAFTTSPPATGPAYARDARGGARSGQNVVSIVPQPGYPAYDAYYGGIKAEFTSGHRFVSIDAKPMLGLEPLGTPTAQPFIQAFDKNGLVVATTYYPIAFGDAQWGSWQTLAVTSLTTNITSVVFSSALPSSGPPVFAIFDNLSFNTQLPTLMIGIATGEAS